MTESAQDQQWRQADERVRKTLPPGVTLVHTLRGHSAAIGRIAWSPDGRMLASPSEDGTIRLWDTKTGECLRTLRTHDVGVFSVSFDPTGRTLASGGRSYAGRSYAVTLWDVRDGEPLGEFEGHVSLVTAVVFHPARSILVTGSTDTSIRVWNITNGEVLSRIESGAQIMSLTFDHAGRVLFSGSGDGTIRLWDILSGKQVGALAGHQGGVHCIASNPVGRMLASGSKDKTVKLWDRESGKLIRTLEGSTDAIEGLSFSCDGKFLAATERSGVRIFESNLGNWPARIPEEIGSDWLTGLAFHPRLPLLATVGSDPDAQKDARLVHIYALDFALLRGRTAAPTITYTSAKVVLVGESNVGKSYLAHRMATGSQPPDGAIKSTHGMKFWPLEPDKPNTAQNEPPKKQDLPSPFAEKLFGQSGLVDKHQRRDIVLWDMGGQEEYRLIHQLFLHDTTVALVLLDPKRGVTAFKEVESWNKSLEKQLRGRPSVKLLIGAKVDQPSGMIDYQGLEHLRNECGFVKYCETSAITGRGVGELCEAIANAIDWDGLGKTSRPELFQRIHDEIETRRKKGEVVLSIRELLRSLSSSGNTDEEGGAVNAVTEQLAAQGVIALSKVATGERVLVLQVQEIERYAGSLILAARNNPRGVPALELRAIAQEGFQFPEIADSERLPPAQEKPVVECTVELLLAHGICFEH